MADAKPISRYRLTNHAREQMRRRQIGDEEVAKTLTAPEQAGVVRPGRMVYQSRFFVGDKTYLLRVFVDVDRERPEVVTVYRTSKVSKYWRSER